MKSKYPPPNWGVQLYSPGEVGRTFVTMRDGAKLYIEVFRPDAPGPFPVLLLRNPYHNVGMPPQSRGRDTHRELVSRGYAVVEAEVRGTGLSEGQFRFLHNDGDDGYDTILWIMEQPWCDGNIGLMGGSYLAMDQFAVAAQNPPGLKAMLPEIGGADLYNDMAYRGGVLNLLLIRWTIGQIAHITAPKFPQFTSAPEEVEPAIYEMQEKCHGERIQASVERALAGLPLYEDTFFKEWMAHPNDGPFWQEVSPYSFFSDIKTPVFCLGGWFDFFIEGTLRSFVEIDAPKKLLIGRWFHGEREGFDSLNVKLRWFDYWLKGIDTGVMDEPPVRLFVMGKNEWRYEQTWPPPATSSKFFLRSGDAASGSLNSGNLSLSAPGDSEAFDEIAHDPARPVPSIAYRNADIRRAEEAMLTYTTEPLDDDIEVTGPVEVRLYTSTDATDVDWFVKLTEVHPDGSSIVLSSGVLKGSHYRSHEFPEELAPGRIYPLTIPLASLCRVFPKGHRIRIGIANSDFPEFNLNPLASTSRVYRDAERASHLLLPVRG